MSTVGPTLPPHLQKRKRSTSDPEDPASPPSKIQAAEAPRRVLGPAPPSKNPDELNLEDSSSEDGYGPAAAIPERTSPPKRTMGPSALPSRNPDELHVEDASSEEDDYAPARAAPAKRVLGPTAPPAHISEMPSHAAHADSSDSEDDDDDDYGPALPPAPGSEAAARLAQQQRTQDNQRAQSSAGSPEPARPQRAEWMLAPPSDSDWTTRVDPTKLKNRKFASGKGSKAPAEKSGVSAIWTETPEQKRQRLEDEVLGRKDKDSASSSRGAAGRGGNSREDEETTRRIREYNDRNRNKSLMEEHKGGGGAKKEEEDDPSKRGFDREKDMALGGRLGHSQKREMLAKAADFGSRFQKGKYL